jgi:integrase
MNAFDVRVYAIRRRTDRRRPFEVRWHAAGRAWSRSFTTQALADGFRAELVAAARRGVRFSPATGHPASWAAAAPAAMTWLAHAAGYATAKWPQVAAHTRAGIADALATITPALTLDGPGRPAAPLLRAALYGWAFNPGSAGRQPPGQIATALAWAQRHSLPLASLTDPQVTRRALDVLTLRLDGSRAAAATIARKRAVLFGALGYAVELGLLDANPLSLIAWRPPRSCLAVNPRAVASPAQAEAILAEVARIRPELAAFFACLYYAALRPEEAVALTATCCRLPATGWGALTLSAAAPRSAKTWTGNGTSHERRGLKLRPDGAVRTVPIPPRLVGVLRDHLTAHRTATDGRLFAAPRGGLLHESCYGRAWHAARAAALGPELTATALARRPYDLRHSALSLWLAAGAPPAEVAARAGHSVQVLLSVYAHCVPGDDQITNCKIETSLSPLAHHWPTKLPSTADAARPPCVHEQLSAAGLNRTPRDPRTRLRRARQAGDLPKHQPGGNGLHLATW